MEQAVKEFAAVADPYYSMAAFWNAMNDHEAGLTMGSIWDTFEAGERRLLEKKLAQLFGAPDAVVICSGMGAIAVAILALCLTKKCHLERQSWCGYFEIIELFEKVFGPLGVLKQEDEEPAAGVRLVEPIANEPSLSINIAALQEPAAAIVIDNSLFSCSIPWSAWQHHVASPFCVVESLPKYLDQRFSGGVIFGERDIVEPIRQIARQMGMFLARDSCRQLLQSNLEATPQKLVQHAQNAELFASVLREHRPDLLTRMPHELARAAGLDNACASLVFVIYPEDIVCLSEFESWARRASEIVGGRPMVRAGYGWSETYGRAYGKNVLNTSKGIEYLRFSIGLEDRQLIYFYADALTRQ